MDGHNTNRIICDNNVINSNSNSSSTRTIKIFCMQYFASMHALICIFLYSILCVFVDYMNLNYQNNALDEAHKDKHSWTMYMFMIKLYDY